LLVVGAAWGLESRAALAAALLSERDPFAGRRGASPERSESDVLDRVRRLEAAGRGRDAGRARAVLRVAKQLERLARGLGRGDDRNRGHAPPDDEAFLRLLVAAMPDRVARRREGGSARGVMVGGRGVRLAETSAVRDAALFLCLDLTAGVGSTRAEAMVRLASRVEVEWLPEAELTRGVETVFDEATSQVAARRRVRFRDLVIEDAPARLPDAGTVSRALAEAASTRLSGALQLDDPSVTGLLLRLAFLREHMPELALPELGDEALRSLLPRLCANKRSFAELRRVPLAGELLSLLDHRQRRALDEHAPERLRVPSGSTIALRYEPGAVPVLAVRIQEIFGWTETPRLAAGRVPVLLHLLAPNHRPQQVTDDLASFWRETYGQVRKDLRARYPRHAWPEDPVSAQAVRGPKPRR
jgi:ATP-dependent helicase HrpB